MKNEIIKEFRTQELYGSKFDKVVLIDLGDGSYSVKIKYTSMVRFDELVFSGKNALELANYRFCRAVNFLLS